MRILITGATGFLGHHVVERLRDRHELVLLSRSGRPQAGVGVVRGDVTQPATLDKAADGAEVLIHMAGLVSQRHEDAQRLFDVHVRGTENALDAAKRAGVRRVVYVSTSGTVAIAKSDKRIADERSPTPMELIVRWPYYRTKLFAEEAAMQRNAPDFQVVSLNPTLLLGPGDRTGESTKSVRMFLEDQVPVAPPGGLSFVDVRDVAAAVETALWRGHGGKRYLLGAINLPFSEFYARLARLVDRKPPALTAPRAFRQVLEFLPDLGKDGFGFGFTVDRVGMEQACVFWYLDDALAKAELGWSPRDPSDTLRDTVADIARQARGMALPPALQG